MKEMDPNQQSISGDAEVVEKGEVDFTVDGRMLMIRKEYGKENGKKFSNEDVNFLLERIDELEKDRGSLLGLSAKQREHSAWMTVTMVEGFYKPDGVWCKGCVHGYVRLVTDREFKEGFHSSEKWQLLVYSNEDIRGLPRMIIPGCKVRVSILWKEQHYTGISNNLGPEHYDARIYPL